RGRPIGGAYGSRSNFGVRWLATALGRAGNGGKPPTDLTTAPLPPQRGSKLPHSKARAISAKDPKDPGSGANGELDYAILTVGKQVICLANITQTEVVRQQRSEIDAVSAHEGQETPHAFLAPWTQCRRDSMIAKPGGKRLVRHL